MNLGGKIGFLDVYYTLQIISLLCFELITPSHKQKKLFFAQRGLNFRKICPICFPSPLLKSISYFVQIWRTCPNKKQKFCTCRTANVSMQLPHQSYEKYAVKVNIFMGIISFPHLLGPHESDTPFRINS